MKCPPCTHSCDEGRDCPARVAAEAMRGWFIEFDCDGTPWTWSGLAYSERGAELMARECIGAETPYNPATARLVACVER